MKYLLAACLGFFWASSNAQAGFELVCSTYTETICDSCEWVCIPRFAACRQETFTDCHWEFTPEPDLY